MSARVWCLLVPVIALLLGCGGGDGASGDAQPRPTVTLVGVGSGDLVDVGGRRLYVECVGSGSPTVLLEAGFGGSSRDWNSVLPALAGTTRTCAYDRAGLGGSDALAGVHDAGDEIEDLGRLLDRARIGPPYVLVGHSYGGMLVRLFARAHPDQAAGMVLVDAMGLDSTRRQLAIWPPSVAPAQRRRWAKPVIDGVDLRAGERMDRSIRSLGDMPLMVITAAQHRGELDLPPWLYRAGERLWSDLQAELAALSSDHVHVVASRSDHFIQGDQPRVVMQAIRAVVRAVRDHAPLPSCSRVFTASEARCVG